MSDDVIRARATHALIILRLLPQLCALRTY